MNLDPLDSISPTHPHLFPLTPPQAPQKTLKSLNLHHSITTQIENSPPIHFSTIKIPGEDPLLQELEQILRIQQSQIEKELGIIESSQAEEETFRALLEAGSWYYGVVNTTKTTIKKGLHFLDTTLPPFFLEKLPAIEFEQVRYLMGLGGAFLGAVNLGCHGLALICQAKILQQGEELLQSFQENYKTIKHSLSKKERAIIRKKLKAWESGLRLQGKDLNEKQLNFMMDGLSNTLYLISLPLSKSSLFAYSQVAVFGLSSITGILGILALGLELKRVEKHVVTIDQWLQTYQEWQSEHHPQFSITPEQVRRENFKPVPSITFAKKEESKQILFKFINRAKNLEDIQHLLRKLGMTLAPSIKTKEAFLSYLEENRSYCQQLIIKHFNFFTEDSHKQALFNFIENKSLVHIQHLLKNLDMPLASSITTKETFRSYLEENPSYLQKLVTRFSHFQNELEKLEVVIQTSQDLLTKRHAIVQKKVLLLQPHFHMIDKQIHQLKKDHFIREMQQLLWQAMQETPFTPQLFQEILEKWGFFSLPPSEKNQQLLEAFGKFKQVSIKAVAEPALTIEAAEAAKGEIVSHQQNLIKEFHRWVQDPLAMDEHFQEWYHQQSKKDLTQSYVDHQEVIENTTKTALKQMIYQKHQIESHFSHFKRFLSRIHFSIAAVTVTISLTLALLGLLSIPFGGAGLILLALSLGTTTLSVGLFGLSYYYAYSEKPHTTKTLSIRHQVQMAWTRTRSSIHSYLHQAKEKKLREVADILYNMSIFPESDKADANYQKNLSRYIKAKQEFEESRVNVQRWTKKLLSLEDHLKQKNWQDFAEKASLQIQDNPLAFDTLRAFKEGFQACDFSLLSPETRTLLEIQLGIDLQDLQTQLKENPEIIERKLQEFFALDDDGLASFITKQNTPP